MALWLHSAHFQNCGGPQPLGRQESRAFFDGTGDCCQRNGEVQEQSCARLVHNTLVLNSGRIIPLTLAKVSRSRDPTSKVPIIVLKQRETELVPKPPPAKEGIEVPQAPRRPVPPAEPPKEAVRRPTFRRTIVAASAIPKPTGSRWLLCVVPEPGESNDSAVSTFMRKLAERGAIVSEFEVRPTGKSLGSGTFASIHLADVACSDVASGGWEDRLALKVYRKPTGGCAAEGDAADDALRREAMAELKREVEMLVAVQGHPNILKFHGCLHHTDEGKADKVDEADAVPRIASGICVMMEYCTGGDLFRLVYDRRTGIGEAAARNTVQGLMKGLEHIHGRSIIHRDIKLANVLLRGDGGVTLADFGLSCRMSDKENLMRICGTPGYMAPEVVAHQGSSPESDIFGVGVVLYALLCGKLPFSGRDAKLILARTVQCQLRFNNPSFDRVSAECRQFVTRLLEKEWQRRPTATAALLGEWLSDDKLAIKVRKAGARTCELPLHNMCLTKSDESSCKESGMHGVLSDEPSASPKRRIEPSIPNPTAIAGMSKLPSLDMRGHDLLPSAASTRGFFASAKVALGNPLARMLNAASAANQSKTHARRSVSSKR